MRLFSPGIDRNLQEPFNRLLLFISRHPRAKSYYSNEQFALNISPADDSQRTWSPQVHEVVLSKALSGVSTPIHS